MTQAFATDTKLPASYFLPTLSGFMSEAVSQDTRVLAVRMSELRNPTSPSMMVEGGDAAGPSLEERLFDARAAAKQLMAAVAMHVTSCDRARIFRQLDSMHEIEEWPESDHPLVLESFASFLRTLLEIRPSKYPSLGLTHDGLLLAAWGEETDRLVVEFVSRRRIRWSLTRVFDEQQELAAGETSPTRIAAVLAPYEPVYWFRHEQKGS